MIAVASLHLSCLLHQIEKKRKTPLRLNNAIVNAYWQRENKDLHSVLNAMDEKETWCLDNQATVSSKLLKFCDLLNKAEDINSLKTKISEFLTVLAYIHSSKAFRILKWIDENHSHLSIKLVSTSQIIIKRNKNRHSSSFDDDEDEDNEFNEDVSYYSHTPEQLFIDRLMALKYLTLTNKIFSDTRGYIVDMYLKKVEESLKEESEEE